MDYVIVGGDAAGMSAAMQIFKYNQDAKITILEEGEIYSYGQCGIPYVVSKDIQSPEELIVREAKTYRKKFNMIATVNMHVIKVIPDDKQVIAKNIITGEHATYPYDKLLIASGGSPFIPNWEGRGLNGVFPVKTIPGVKQINQYIENYQVKQSIIVGGGYIALEMAESLKNRGIDVTLLIRSDEIGKMFDKDMQVHLVEEAKKAGVNVCFDEDVKQINGKSRVESVETTKGKHDADLVIVATGIQPNTQFLKETAIKLSKNGAVKVNQYLETNIKDIYAAGDCAMQYHRVKKQLDYVPLGTHANKQGRIAGMNMVGEKRDYAGMLGSSILRFFNQTLAKTGISNKEAENLNINFDSVTLSALDIAGYYPGHEKMHIKATYNKDTLELLGAQIIGGNGVDKRIDVLSTAIFNQMNALKIEDLDLSYSPIYNGVWDPVHRMARKIVSQASQQN